MMSSTEAGRYWEENAEAWTQLSRRGYDVCRDLFNTPAFMRILPDVNGLRGLDIGCGDGHNTRLVAARGAKMTAFDIAPTFIRYAVEAERRQPLAIGYLHAGAHYLPFAARQFDFVVAFMSLMDMPEQKQVVAEIHRILKPDAFFQFSISHPFTDHPYRQWISDETGKRVAMAVRDYFDNRQYIDEWTFGAAPKELKTRYKPFKTPYFTKTLSQWLNMLIEAGFILERFEEPCADENTARDHPEVADSRIAPFFLIVRCRKTTI